MEANSGKSHLLMSGTETTHAIVDGSTIKCSQKEILLGINLDSELKFEDHVNFMCKKASQKFHALARITPFMELKQRRNMKALLNLSLDIDLNNKINCIHERALRITHKDKYSTFQEQLKKDNSVSIHHRNVQKLAIEIYKVLHGFSPPILNEIFVPVSRSYNFR